MKSSASCCDVDDFILPRKIFRDSHKGNLMASFGTVAGIAPFLRCVGVRALRGVLIPLAVFAAVFNWLIRPMIQT